jgi:hypothetical protein
MENTMKEYNLKIFDKNYLEEKIDIFWVDDEEHDIQIFIRKLADHNINVQYFESPNEFTNHFKRIKEERYKVGIVDLRFDNSTHDGLTLASSFNGLYSSRFKAFPRLGTVTGHKDQFSSLLYKFNLFLFTFTKAQISNNYFDEFIKKIIYHAVQFDIDREAIKFIEENPVNENGYKLLNTIFGYVVEIENDNIIVKLWDPYKPNSDSLRRYDREYLNKNHINEINQSFRISTFLRKSGDATLQRIDAIDLNNKTWQPIYTNITS